jgi:acetyl esterase
MRSFCRFSITALVMFATFLGPHASASSIHIVPNVLYAERGVPLYVDEYLPTGSRAHPAALLIHGGKWASGDRQELSDLGRFLAEHNYAAFAIDYRLAPQYPFPAAVTDVLTAVRWVRENARRLHVDPARIGIVGGSSGGNLAALAGTWGSGALDRGARVRAVVSLSGPMELSPLLHDPQFIVRFAVERFLGCGGGVSCRGPARAASPITHVDPSDPPMLLTNGAEEIIPFQQALDMQTALQKASVPVQVTQVPGANHGVAAPLFPVIVSFLDEYLAGTAPKVSDSPGATPAFTVEPTPRSAPASGLASRSLWLVAFWIVVFAVFAAILGLAVRIVRRARDR